MDSTNGAPAPELTGPMNGTSALTMAGERHGGTRSDAVACTIISKNYLAYARVLCNSFRTHHPDIQFVVLLVDRVDGYFDPGAESFEFVTLEQLSIPDLSRFCFQYTPIELNTAAKPYFLDWLFTEQGYQKVIYLDPDILICRRLDPLLAMLDTWSVVLTPHLTAPLPQDGRQPHELGILLAGTYNLGFLALRKGATASGLLAWWQERLYDKCRMALAEGMHVDQKWIDLVPGFFPDVSILREPGYNVAYWNLSHRTITQTDGDFLANGQPLYFFHFSGFDPNHPRRISKHDTRLTPETVGQAALLYAHYMTLLLAQGYREKKVWPYAYGYFDDGMPIPELVRGLYLQLGDDARRYGDPYRTTGPATFSSWLNEALGPPAPRDRAITRLWQAIYHRRPDVQQAFPDLFGADRDAFLAWSRTRGRIEFAISDHFVNHPPTEAQRDTAVQASAAMPPASRDDREFGVNVAGYLQSEKGMGEAVRSAVRILNAAKVPIVLNDFADSGSINDDLTHTTFAEENPYAVNLVVINAGELPHFERAKGRSYFKGRYNIAHWAWELADFPWEWLPAFGYFDQVWVASNFIRDALVPLTTVPIKTVPYALTGELPTLNPAHRLRFGLPPDTFTFFFMFDFHSFMERKNPLGLIEAFKRAFTPRDDALLLLKCSHSEGAPEELRRLQEAARGANIRLTDRVLSREQTRQLMARADCYVALHRAEGFGLPLAEAMLMEKPVIATAYSGNTDFMTADNSFPVRYTLIPIGRDHGPYKKDFVWADPDVAHAAELMRAVYDDREHAAAIGRRARRDILATLSPAAIGKSVERHLLTLTGR